MRTEAQIRARVMRRVYAMYWARQLMKPSTRLVVTVFLGLALVSVVSVVNVLTNVPYVNGVPGVLAFFLAAFFGTSVTVQAMLVALAGSVGWFVADALRKIFPFSAQEIRVSS